MREIPPQAIRLAVFFRRLEGKEPFGSFEEACRALISTLEEVEDELTGIPNNPARWEEDGRLYPPQEDNWFELPGRSGVTRMRTKGHNIFIAANGALEVQTAQDKAVLLSKAGADGRKVWDDD